MDVLLLGNKSDCEKKVETEKAKEYTNAKGYDFEEVSAKTADRVAEAIKEFGRKVAEKKARRGPVQEK